MHLSISFLFRCSLELIFTVSSRTAAVAVEPAKEVVTKKKNFAKQRRVVVTGLGVVTPLGHEPDLFYKNLLDGVSGITEIDGFDCASFPTVLPFFFPLI